MNHVRIRRESKSVPVTLTTSVATSASLRASGSAGGVVMVSGVTASATLTIWGSHDGQTFAPVFDASGAAATLVVPADGGAVVVPDAAFALRSLKLTSDIDLGTNVSVVVTLKS